MDTGDTQLHVSENPWLHTTYIFVADVFGWELREYNHNYKTAIRTYTPTGLKLQVYVPIYVLMLRHINKRYKRPVATINQDQCTLTWTLADSQLDECAWLAFKYLSSYDQIRKILCEELPQPIFEEIAAAFF